MELSAGTGNNSAFKDQLNILGGIDAEKYGFIYVVGSAAARSQSGYSVKIEEAKAMLSRGEFQIRVYDEFGNLVRLSSEVVTEQEFIRHLMKKSKERGH